MQLWSSLQQYWQFIDHYLSLKAIAGILPPTIRDSIASRIIGRCFHAYFNQRNIISLPWNFFRNFFPIWLWLMCFKNAGYLPRSWRPPIHNGLTLRWDTNWFSFTTVSGWIFLLFTVILGFVFAFAIFRIVQWSDEWFAPTLDVIKARYYFFNNLELHQDDDAYGLLSLPAIPNGPIISHYRRDTDVELHAQPHFDHIETQQSHQDEKESYDENYNVQTHDLDVNTPRPLTKQPMSAGSIVAITSSSSSRPSSAVIIPTQSASVFTNDTQSQGQSTMTNPPTQPPTATASSASPSSLSAPSPLPPRNHPAQQPISTTLVSAPPAILPEDATDHQFGNQIIEDFAEPRDDYCVPYSHPFQFYMSHSNSIQLPPVDQQQEQSTDHHRRDLLASATPHRDDPVSEHELYDLSAPYDPSLIPSHRRASISAQEATTTVWTESPSVTHHRPLRSQLPPLINAATFPATTPSHVKSLRNIMQHVDPWIFHSNMAKSFPIKIMALFVLLSWFILNIDQFFATPLSKPKDVLAWILYVPCHAVAPISTGIYLYVFHPPGVVAGFAFALGIQNLLGVWTHLFWPSTPPWFHTLYPPGTPATYDTRGYSAGLARIDKEWGTHFVKDGFNANKIVFGALPSLHSAIAVQSMFFVLWYCWLLPGKILFVTYVCIQWWATIYLEHHWRLDLIVGMWYSMFAFVGILPYLLYMDNYYKEQRYVRCDTTSPNYRTFGMRLFKDTPFEFFFDPYYVRKAPSRFDLSGRLRRSNVELVQSGMRHRSILRSARAVISPNRRNNDDSDDDDEKNPNHPKMSHFADEDVFAVE